LNALALFLLLSSVVSSLAVTEVTFTREKDDQVQVETDSGEKRVYRDPGAPPDNSQYTNAYGAALFPVSPNRRLPTSGKVLSTPLVPVDERTDFKPLDGDYAQGTDLLQPAAGDTTPIVLPATDNERLQAELDRTRAELARVSRLLHSPVIVSLHGDSARLEWADARQQITIPRDGVIKIQLAPK
jgi:hypothetical protein